MTGRNRLDVGEQRVGIGRPEKRQKLVQRFRVQFRLNNLRREDCFDLRAEDKRRRRLEPGTMKA